MLISTRIEQLNITPAACQQMKATANGDLQKCFVTTLMGYNRSHGRGDFDKPAQDIRESAFKGCAIMLEGFTEEQYDRVRKKVGPP